MNNNDEINKIIEAFYEFISAQKYMDIVLSKKFGYLYISSMQKLKWNKLIGTATQINSAEQLLDIIIENMVLITLDEDKIECFQYREGIEKVIDLGNKYFIQLPKYEKTIEDTIEKHALYYACEGARECFDKNILEEI